MVGSSWSWSWASPAAGAVGSRPGDSSNASPRSSVVDHDGSRPGAVSTRGPHRDSAAATAGSAWGSSSHNRAGRSPCHRRANDNRPNEVATPWASIDWPSQRVGHGRQQGEAATGLVHGEAPQQVEHGRGRGGVVPLARAQPPPLRGWTSSGHAHTGAPRSINHARGSAASMRPTASRAAPTRAVRRGLSPASPGACQTPPLTDAGRASTAAARAAASCGRRRLGTGEGGGQGDRGGHGARGRRPTGAGAGHRVGGERRRRAPWSARRRGLWGRPPPRAGRRPRARTRRRAGRDGPTGRRGRSGPRPPAPTMRTVRPGTGRPCPHPGGPGGRPGGGAGGGRPWPPGRPGPRRGSGSPVTRT